MAAARKFKYEPRTLKKRVPAAERRTIGFQFFADRPTDTLQVNQFYGAILYGVQTEATRLGLNLMVQTADRHALTDELPRTVADWQIEGMLLVGGVPDVRMAEIYAMHVPHVVLLDNRDVTGRYESVTSDGFGGGFQAARHLMELGHRRIGFVLPEAGVEPFEERMRGYQWALQSSGLPPHSVRVLTLEYDMPHEAWERQFDNLLRQQEPPTALIAANDDTAVSILRLCKDRGIRVPEDMSLVGFDDMPFCEHLNPPLTTLRVEKEFMGRLAVRRLFARLADTENDLRDEPFVQHTVPVRLVKRGSCSSVGD